MRFSPPKKLDSVTPQEIKALMSFYLAMWPTTQTGFLLSIAGFKIAGLADRDLRNLKSLGHRFAWNEEIGFGMCTCGQWQTEKNWGRELGMAQQAMHARKIKLDQQERRALVLAEELVTR